jgi:hypothetical protein
MNKTTTSLPAPFGDELDLTLTKPIKLGELEYSVLNLTEPTGEQLAAAEAAVGATGSLMVLIERNASVPAGVVKKMRQRDLQRAADFFAHFGTTDDSIDTESSSLN